MLAAATPTPATTDGRNDDIDMQPDTDRDISADAVAFERSVEGLPEDEREAKKQKFREFVEEERGGLATSSAHLNTICCACSPLAATGKDFGWRRITCSWVASKSNLDNYQRPTSQPGNLDS